MAILYLRCGTGVSSFVIHSTSSSSYPKTVTSSSYTAYTGFAATSTDAYVTDVVYESGYSGATIYSSTTGTEWSVSSDRYISLATYSTRYAEVRATYTPTTSYWVRCEAGTGLNNFTYIRNSTSGTGTTTTLANINTGASGYMYLKGFSFASGYGYPVTVTTTNPTSTWTIDSAATSDYYRTIDPPSGGGTRGVTLTASVIPTYYYYRYQWLLPDGTSVALGQLMAGTSTSGGIYITLSSIPSYTGYTKTGSYTAIQNCSINLSQGYAYCTGTTEARPSIIGVYVTPSTLTYYYQYRYIKNGTTISTSSTMSAQSTSGSISVTLSDIPTISGYVKTGTYTAVRSCTIHAAYDYAECTSTSSSSPSIIGVYITDAISPFYWFGSEAADASRIQAGKVREMTALMWADFADVVSDLAAICGVSVNVIKPGAGTTMFAVQYNSAVIALEDIKVSRTAFRNVSIPGYVTAHVTLIMAAQFQAANSVKGALNAMINLL